MKKKNRCPRCGGKMKIGQALENILGGIPDFPDGAVCTVSPTGRARMIACRKCRGCGHSVTIGIKQ